MIIDMDKKKSLFEKPYDLKDVSFLFGIVAIVLIIAALLGNNLFGIFQDNINFGNIEAKYTFGKIIHLWFSKIKYLLFIFKRNFEELISYNIRLQT